jgi:PTS system fructose-specific IIC component
MARIVAITGCPAGVAHTFMAAEALKKTAALLGQAAGRRSRLMAV